MLGKIVSAGVAHGAFEQGHISEGWKIYEQWSARVWSGEVGQVIAALAQRQQELGGPEAQESETSPRAIVAQALTYLQNHQNQMRYAESAVKQFNQRVKGTEKF